MFLNGDLHSISTDGQKFILQVSRQSRIGVYFQQQIFNMLVGCTTCNQLDVPLELANYPNLKRMVIIIQHANLISTNIPLRWSQSVLHNWLSLWWIPPQSDQWQTLLTTHKSPSAFLDTDYQWRLWTQLICEQFLALWRELVLCSACQSLSVASLGTWRG